MANDKIQEMIKDFQDAISEAEKLKQTDPFNYYLSGQIDTYTYVIEKLRSLPSTESRESDAVEFAEWIGNNEFKRNQEGEDIWYESNG